MIGSWQLMFFAGKVFLVNFSFSFPRIPRVASLPFFWVFVVKDKTKIFLKILAEILYTVWLYLLRGADTFLFALVLNSKILPIIPRPFACKGGGARGGVRKLRFS